MTGFKNKCSLCISTYNWPKALRQCLLSIKAQTVLPLEVIIGDDGSTSETRDLIEEMMKDFPIPIVHVWQPDEGFRLAAIRNKSFAKATGDYIIQSDGDVIFHPDFIKDHLIFARNGAFIIGARCMLNKSFTEQVLEQSHNPTVNQMLQHCTKKYNGIRLLPLASINYLFTRQKSQIKYVLGANMSFFKSDLVAINGYNESYTGWGKEDNDLALRLLLANIKPRSLKFAGNIFHLFHIEAEKVNLDTNTVLFQQTIKDKITFATKGINQYL